MIRAIDIAGVNKAPRVAPGKATSWVAPSARGYSRPSDNTAVARARDAHILETAARVALDMDRVEHCRPPPNCATETDTRFAFYTQQSGCKCWELGALEPTVIADLIRIEVEWLIDADAWNLTKAQEEDGRAQLSAAEASLARSKYLLGKLDDRSRASRWQNLETSLAPKGRRAICCC
jgi:hypothetical protein